jgi:hypothetical protein
MVLKDISMFHNRHRRQPLFKCCHDMNRIRLSTSTAIPDIKDKHSATVCLSPTDDTKDRYDSLSSFVSVCSFDMNEQRSFFRVSKPKYNRNQSLPSTAIPSNNYDARRLAIQVIVDNSAAHVDQAETTTTETNSTLPYRSMLDIDEPETFYCLNVSFYQPITQPKHNHEVSLLSMHHIIDFNHLQMLR